MLFVTDQDVYYIMHALFNTILSFSDVLLDSQDICFISG